MSSIITASEVRERLAVARAVAYRLDGALESLASGSRNAVEQRCAVATATADYRLAASELDAAIEAYALARGRRAPVGTEGTDDREYALRLAERVITDGPDDQRQDGDDAMYAIGVARDALQETARALPDVVAGALAPRSEGRKPMNTEWTWQQCEYVAEQSATTDRRQAEQSVSIRRNGNPGAQVTLMRREVTDWTPADQGASDAQELPTFSAIIARAIRECGEALDTLRSDWHPDAGPSSGRQADARREALRLIRQAQEAMERAAR